MPRRELDNLRKLASAHGVESGYLDWQGRPRTSPPDSVMAALRALDVPIRGPADAAALLSQRGKGRELTLLPVAVAWDGRLKLRAIPPGSRCTLTTEAGDAAEWTSTEHDPAPRKVPLGRLNLAMHKGRTRREISILSAPRRFPSPGSKRLGIFAPLYALRSRHSWGAGDLGDLQRLKSWTADQGASVVGTLPMLAAFLDKPFEPSPYAPVSRLFWNEFYLDVPAAAGEFGVRFTPPNLADHTRGSKVDYRWVMAAKRRVLERITRAAFKSDSRRAEIDAFVRARPEVNDYAAFRAMTELRGDTWQHWPAARNGSPRGAPAPAREYHTFVQFLMDRQLRTLRGTGTDLYLDLPIGVHAGGYDTWRHREAFVHGVSVGAPPDGLFHGGQNWGFPPPHPQHPRKGGHAYFAACLRNHFTYCKLLRIDHVMGLHRLYWIPEGLDAKDGVYVRYPLDELFAVLSIEAHRASACVVGENLGTVPEEVNRAMDRHGVLRMFVGQFAMSPRERRPMAPAPAGHLASLNTHDTPTFAGYLSGKEIDLRMRLGILDPPAAAAERAARDQQREAILRYAAHRLDTKQATTKQALRVLLHDLAASDADIVLVTLEDLWLESEPQNLPGVAEYPAWRRRLRKDLEQILRSRDIAGLLRALATLRREPQRVPAGRKGASP